MKKNKGTVSIGHVMLGERPTSLRPLASALWQRVWLRDRRDDGWAAPRPLLRPSDNSQLNIEANHTPRRSGALR